MCGEKFFDDSPRTEWAGITPACAGKSLTPYYKYKNGKDHPRVCGEKKDKLTPEEYELGSPPRVRGKVSYTIHSYRISRITPACAGKRLGVNNLREKSKDHPRVCGEKWNIIREMQNTIGSPPRVRGKE